MAGERLFRSRWDPIKIKKKPSWWSRFTRKAEQSPDPITGSSTSSSPNSSASIHPNTSHPGLDIPRNRGVLGTFLTFPQLVTAYLLGISSMLLGGSLVHNYYKPDLTLPNVSVSIEPGVESQIPPPAVPSPVDVAPSPHPQYPQQAANLNGPLEALHPPGQMQMDPKP